MSGQPVPVFDYAHNKKDFLKRNSLSAISKVNTLLYHFYLLLYIHIFYIASLLYILL